jgi:hypothetical protein
MVKHCKLLFCGSTATLIFPDLVICAKLVEDGIVVCKAEIVVNAGDYPQALVNVLIGIVNDTVPRGFG